MIRFNPLSLKAFRANNGLSVDKLAELIGYSSRTVRNYEKVGTDNCNMTISAYLKIINKYKLPIDAFFESDEDIKLSKDKETMQIVDILSNKIQSLSTEYAEYKIISENKIKELTEKLTKYENKEV